MYKYIEKMLMKLPLDMNGLSKTPAMTYLFNLHFEADKLDEHKAQIFHHARSKSTIPKS